MSLRHRAFPSEIDRRFEYRSPLVSPLDFADVPVIDGVNHPSDQGRAMKSLATCVSFAPKTVPAPTENAKAISRLMSAFGTKRTSPSC